MDAIRNSKNDGDQNVTELKDLNSNNQTVKDDFQIFNSQEGQTAGLSIAKLIFAACLSVLDVLTDVLFAFNLINRDDASFFGYLVLASCWIPGLVAVIHMIAYYRFDYLEKLLTFFYHIGSSLCLLSACPICVAGYNNVAFQCTL